MGEYEDIQLTTVTKIVPRHSYYLIVIVIHLA